MDDEPPGQAPSWSYTHTVSTAAASPVAEQTYHLFMSSPGVMPHKKKSTADLSVGILDKIVFVCYYGYQL